MDIFNVINNRLIKKGFQSMDSLEIEKLGAVIYRSPINHVVLKKIHTYDEIGEIMSFSSKIRSIQLDAKVNISNTYLLFCIMKELDYETFFMIERDTKALRKYVIRNEMDLNRIPFLDDLMNVSKDGIDIKEKQEENFYLKKIYDFLKIHNGQNNKLDNIAIEESINMIIDMVEDRYEY